MQVVKDKPERGMKYLAKETRLLKIFGISFREDENIAYRCYSFVMLFSLNFLYPVIQLKEVFQTKDFEIVSEMLIWLNSCYVAMCKTAVILRNRTKFRKMVERLEEEPFTPNLERGGIEEENLINECVRITNIQTPVYLIVAYITLFGDMMYAVITRIRSNDPNDWKMPFGPLNIVNVTYSPNYEATLFYESLSITFLGSHFLLIDLLMATVLAHTSYQFRMLQNNIRHIMINCYRDMQQENDQPTQTSSVIDLASDASIDGSKIPWKYLHKHLKQVIDYHLAIINLAEDMEDVFSPLLLLIFLGTLGILCFAAYTASMVEDNLRILISMLAAATGACQVLFVCYWGEEVAYESQQVARAAYEVDFTGTDLRFQKGLALIIRRSQNPTKLTVGKFSDVCLATFTWTVRTSYSAFMVIRGKNAAEKVG